MSIGEVKVVDLQSGCVEAGGLSRERMLRRVISMDSAPRAGFVRGQRLYGRWLLRLDDVTALREELARAGDASSTAPLPAEAGSTNTED